MKNTIIALALLHVGACATSTTVEGGDDGGSRPDAPGFDAPGFDAPGFDAPGFDAPGFDAPGFDAPGFDAGSFEDTGPVPDAEFIRDAGAPGSDSGPVIFDAGSMPDVGPIACMPAGTYGATAVVGNPSICDVAGVTTCTASPSGSPSSVTLSCAGISVDCEFTRDCACTGSTVFMGFPINVSVDFDMGLATFSAAGMACNFTLMML